MGSVYFLRHGETFWNVEQKVCGITDIELTPAGHRQAVQAAKMLQQSKIKIDEIWYSPLSRAAMTAKHIAEQTGIPLKEEPRLLEQNFGSFEGTDRHSPIFKEARQQFINHYGGGESMFEMAQRIYNLLDEIKDISEDRTILLVSHSGVARVVQSYFHDMTNEEFAGFRLSNCEVLKYEFNQKKER